MGGRVVGEPQQWQENYTSPCTPNATKVTKSKGDINQQLCGDLQPSACMSRPSRAIGGYLCTSDTLKKQAAAKADW